MKFIAKNAFENVIYNIVDNLFKSFHYLYSFTKHVVVYIVNEFKNFYHKPSLNCVTAFGLCATNL